MILLSNYFELHQRNNKSTKCTTKMLKMDMTCAFVCLCGAQKDSNIRAELLFTYINYVLSTVHLCAHRQRRTRKEK